MNKRLRITLLTAFILIVYSCSIDLKKDIGKIKAVPENAFMLFESEDIENAFLKLGDNTFWNIVEDDKSIKLISRQLKSINKLLEEHKVSVKGREILISFHKVGFKSFDYIMFFESKAINTEIANILEPYKKSKKHYDNSIIMRYSGMPNIKSPLFVCDYKGVLILSRSQILLEKSIRQINSGKSLIDSPNFRSLYQSINQKEDFSLLVNFNKLNFLDTYTQHKSYINWMPTFSDWVEFDVSPEKKELLLSGIISANDSVGDYLSIFKDQAPQKITIDKLLPYNTSFSVILGFEKFISYQRNFEKYLRQQGRLHSFELSRKAHDIEQGRLFDTWVDNQIAFASISSQNNTLNGINLLLIKSKDSKLAEKSLKLVTSKSSMKFRGYSIYKFSKENILKDYLGDIFKNIKKPYYTIIEDIVVFSDSKKEVISVINDFLESRGISNFKYFETLKNKLSSKSNVIFFYKNPNFAEQLSKIFPDISDLISRNSKKIKEYKSGAAQISFDNGNALINVLLLEATEKESEIASKWELNFSSELYPNISTLTNHYTKNKELAIQDKRNILYLIDSYGKILWSKKLESKIQGRIKQVDVYKNNKLQMVFNTEKYLYILDRNGKNVGSFPRKLSNKSNIPMAVFDYSKTKNYRFLVPMGKRLTMYNSRGEVVSGFRFTKTPSGINKTPQHFRVRGQDYIVVTTLNGNIYILNRKGESRVKIDGLYPLGENKFYLHERGSILKSKIVTTTKKGDLLNVYFNSKVEINKMKNTGNNVQYVENSGVKSIILTDKKLKVDYGSSKKEIEVEANDFTDINIFKMDNKRHVIFSSPINKEVYIYDANMKMMNGFPIYGQFVGKVLDYSKDGIIDLPVIENTDKGTLKMYSIN